MDKRNEEILQCINEGERKKISLEYIANFVRQEINYYIALQKFAVLDGDDDECQKTSRIIEEMSRIVKCYTEKITNDKTLAEIKDTIDSFLEEIDSVEK